MTAILPFVLGSEAESYVMQPSGDNCTVRWHSRDPRTVIVSCVCAVILVTPLTGIGFAYYFIYRKVSRTFESFKATGVISNEGKSVHTSSTGAVTNGSEIRTGTRHLTKQSKREKCEEEAKQMALLIQSLVIVGVFVVGWTPYMLYGTFGLLSGVGLPASVEFAADYVLQVNYLANPFVIFFFDKDIQKNVFTGKDLQRMDSTHRGYAWTVVITEGIAFFLNFTLVVSNARFVCKLPYTSVLIFTLCCSDNLTLINSWTIAATHVIRNTLEYDKRLCQIHAAMVVAGALLSMSLCAGLTLLRYKVIVKAQKITKKFIASYISASVTIAATVASLPFLLGSQDESYFMQPSGDNCTPRWHGRDPRTVIVSTTCGLILATPLIGIGYAYFHIYRKVSTTFEAYKVAGVVSNEISSQSSRGLVNGTILSDTGQQQTKSSHHIQMGKRKKSEEEEKQMHLLIQSIALVGVFVIGWGPYFLFGVIELISGVQQAAEFEFAADFIAQLNYVANPIVILVFDKDIRNNVIRPCSWRFGRSDET
ncbi:hypothetical protein HDU81_004275 [Chytriomyces hyalinus]|nr:hypothetical protein HDU81_004275 [Chytriomyces hyalinus]